MISKKKSVKAIPFQPNPIDPNVKFKIGELVWAKMRGFPPWPAIVAQLSESASSDESVDSSEENQPSQVRSVQSQISLQKCMIEAKKSIQKPIDRENSQNTSQLGGTPVSEDSKCLSPVKFKPYRQQTRFDIRKLLFEEEEKITVNFIGENTHATISVSRVQKWADYYELYSKNRRVRLQPAIQEALRILKDQISYEGKQEFIQDHVEKNKKKQIEEKEQKKEPSIQIPEEPEPEKRKKRKYWRKKPKEEEIPYYSQNTINREERPGT